MKLNKIVFGLFVGSIILETSLAYASRKDWTPAKLEADEFEYYDLSSHLLDSSHELQPRRVLGHVLILSAWRAIVGNRVLPIQLGVSMLFSLTAPLTYLLARREMGSYRAALLSGLGVMLWPPFIWYGATLYSETTALPFFAGFLLAIPGTRRSDTLRTRRWLGAGALLGVCMHIRPMYLLYSPFAALIAYWRGPGRLRGMIPVVALAAGYLLVVLPWSIVLSIHEGTFVFLSSNGGETIAGGLNPELLRIEGEEGGKEYITPAGRSTWVGPGKWLPIHETGLLSAEEQALPYSQRGKVLTRNALTWVRNNPGKASYITLRKLTYMWGIYPFWNGRSQTIIGNVPTLGLMFLGMTALVRYRRYLRELSIFWTLPLFVILVAVMSWGSWRFRQPGDLGLIVLAASLPVASEVIRFLASLSDTSR